MTVPVPPSPGDYQGAASASGVITTAGNSSITGSNDIWGLGDLYGKSVLLGTTPTELPGSRMGLGDQTLGQTPNYGTTQSYMQHVIDLWAAQDEERQKFPNRLTTYEQLQRALWQAGFYGQTSLDSIHVGQWTSQTQSALIGALGNYEQLAKGGKLPLTFSEFLNQNAVMGQDGGQNSGGSNSSSPAPFQANLADPNTIRAVAQNAAQQALGRSLSDDELSKFVQQFQAEQTAAERTAYNGTGTVTQPDLSSEAASFVQQNNPKAYQQNQRSAYLDALVNLLGGTRPSVTPTPSVGG